MAPLVSWEADDGVTGGIGSAVSAWVSGAYTLEQGTAGNRPNHVAAFTAGHGVSFDGVNDFLWTYLSFAGTTGSIAIVFRTGTIGTRQVLVTHYDADAGNDWFEIGITAAGRLYIENCVAGTVSRVVGSSILTASTSYQLFASYDGTGYYLTLNGVEENPLTVEAVGTLGWLSTVNTGDTFTAGMGVQALTGMYFFTGILGLIRIWETDITH